MRSIKSASVLCAFTKGAELSKVIWKSFRTEVLRGLTSGRRWLYYRLKLKERPVQWQSRGLTVVGNIDEPMVPSNRAEYISWPLQPILQFVVRGNILYLVSEVRVGPQLRWNQTVFSVVNYVGLWRGLVCKRGGISMLHFLHLLLRRSHRIYLCIGEKKILPAISHPG